MSTLDWWNAAGDCGVKGRACGESTPRESVKGVPPGVASPLQCVRKETSPRLVRARAVALRSEQPEAAEAAEARTPSPFGVENGESRAEARDELAPPSANAPHTTDSPASPCCA
eukprot:2266529-Pleurochrysis_carterae.AAC.1